MTPPERPEVAALRERHVRATKLTMEPDPTSSMLMRQTAYCQFCASHRPDEDPRWPCETARLLELVQAAAAEPLRGALPIRQLLVKAKAALMHRHDEVEAAAYDALSAALEATAPSTPERHEILFPPHPGGVFDSSALCSCGGFQWDADSPGDLFNQAAAIRRDWTEHATPSTPEPALDVERVMDAEHRWCVQVEGEWALRHQVEGHRTQAEYIVAALTSEPRAAAPQEGEA